MNSVRSNGRRSRGQRHRLETGKFGDWTIVRKLSEGGNATVYVARQGARMGALKVLRRSSHRFEDEVSALKQCQDLSGVLKLLDHSAIPLVSPESPRWMVLELAQLAEEQLGQKPPIGTVVAMMRDYADTLAQMHKREICHRDIKPNNLFYAGRQWKIGDFGLATFPDKRAQTTLNERVGPVFYIAPEMLNSPVGADGKAADVYSLAKTLWKLASGQNYPLPGQISRSVPQITLSALVSDPRAALLDALLDSATHPIPSARPTMQQVHSDLDAWLSPPISTEDGDKQLDLSNLSPLLAGHKEQKTAIDSRRTAAKALALREGTRIRERFRDLSEQLTKSLVAANFVDVRNGINGSQSAFCVWASIQTQDPNQRTVIAISGGRSNIDTEGGKTVIVGEIAFSSPRITNGQHTILWSSRIEVIPGGSTEDLAINQTIDGIKSEFRRCVEDVTQRTLGHQ